mgnify:CR=1 FL=1
MSLIVMIEQKSWYEKWLKFHFPKMVLISRWYGNTFIDENYEFFTYYEANNMSIKQR